MNAPQDDENVATEPQHQRVFTMLENNPNVMTQLAHQLGLSKELSFHDVYSIYDDDMLAMIPRPVHALLVTIPLTQPWKRDREQEDARLEWYSGAGPQEPVMWFQQTITHGCGLIGLIHCAVNGVPSTMITPGSHLAEFREKALPLKMDDRARLLYDDVAMYEASEAVAPCGDTAPITDDGPAGNHFVALVKGSDGHLWELEGARKGPLDRGPLADEDDALSDAALKAGLRRLVEIQRQDGGDDSSLNFSCIALAPSFD